MKISTSKYLAEKAMEQAKEYKLRKGESTEASTGALIQAYAGALTSWQDMEGVYLKRTPKPVPTDVYKANPEVKKMFIMANLINEEGHCFDNLVILN